MERLGKIAACERFLQELQFTQFRVRFHGDLVRIEVAPREIQRFFESSTREAIIQKFKEIGFNYVSLDLEGYWSGRLNKELGNRSAKGHKSQF
jgi:uncharacterized protein